MSRKQREREREQQRKEQKRQRVKDVKPAAVARSVGSGDIAVPALDAAGAHVAAEIADRLGETEQEVRAQIERVVQYVGVEAALAWLEETLAIEAAGGMWLPDGSRRKTPGGVYFKLVQRHAAKPDVLSIFYPEYEQTLPLDERELAERLAGAPGWPLAAAQQVHFSIMGRPATIAPPDVPDQAPYVVFELATDVGQAPQLIKGLPPIVAPPAFRVLAPTQKWPPVADQLVQRPDAQVIVWGYPAIDPCAPSAIVVYASNFYVEGQAPRKKAGKRAVAAAPLPSVTGTVKWFNAEKGYGFITTGEGDVFVHQSALADGRDALVVGERVYLGVREGRKGPEAVDVHTGSPPPPPGPALPTLALPQGAIPARMRLRLVARPPEVALLGRPGQPPSLIAFRAEAAALPVPPGMPAPAGPTIFAVLIPLKHWKRVRDAFTADPQDPLLINGYCSLDPRTPGMILVRTTMIDTAACYQSRRAADRQANAVTNDE